MSRTALVVSIVAAITLSIVAWLTIRPSASQPAGRTTPLLQIDPARVVRVDIDDPDQPFMQSLVRDASRAWSLRLARRDTGETTVWPIIAPRIRTALRALAQRDVQPITDTNATLGDAPLRMTLTLASGATTQLAIASQAVGGQRLARVGDRIGLIADELHQLFTQPGPRGWRSRVALASAGAETSGVTIERDSVRVELRRMQSHWRLVSPVTAPALDAMARSIVTELAKAQVESFEDDPSSEDLAVARLDAPSAVIRVERDVREPNTDGSVASRVVASVLTLGAPADLAGRTRFARVDNDSPLLIITDNGALGALSADPLRYISRSAASRQPENVGMVLVKNERGQAGFRRDASGWSHLEPDGGATPADSAPIDDFLTFLSGRLARSVSIATPDGFHAQGQATLFNFADGPLEIVEFGFDGAGSLTLRTGDIYRAYDGPAPALLSADRAQDQQ